MGIFSCPHLNNLETQESSIFSFNFFYIIDHPIGLLLLSFPFESPMGPMVDNMIKEIVKRKRNFPGLQTVDRRVENSHQRTLASSIASTKRKDHESDRGNSSLDRIFLTLRLSPSGCNERKEKEIPGVHSKEKEKYERRNFPFPWTLLRALINQQ